MAWVTVAAAGASLIGSLVSGGSSKDVGTASGKSGYDPNIQAGSNQAIGLASGAAATPFQPFNVDDAVAGLQPNQQAFITGAADNAQYLPAFEATAAQQFTPQTLAQYENPYVQQVLGAENALATRQYGTEQAQLASRQGMTSAFGGDRSAIANNQLTESFNLQSDLRNKQGLSDAYNAGVSAFNQDRSYAAGQVGQIEGALATSGGLQQQTAQNRDNFNYNQYVTGRDWNMNQATRLSGVLSTVPKGSYYNNSQTGWTNPAGGGWGGAIAGIGGIGTQAYDAWKSNNNTPSPNLNNGSNATSYQGPGGSAFGSFMQPTGMSGGGNVGGVQIPGMVQIPGVTQ